MADRIDDCWLFIVEWFDPLPQLKKKYVLKYYLEDHMIEMIDVKTKKLFLKKSSCPPELTREDFFIGAKVLLYSRELEIIDFGDNKTRQRLQYQSQYVSLIIPSQYYAFWGRIVDLFHSIYTITKMKTFLASPNLLDNISNTLDLPPRQVNVLRDGVNLVILGFADDGYSKTQGLINQLNEMDVSVMYTSNGQQVNDLQNCLLQNKSIASTATLDNSTCAVIKPHAVKTKLVGAILDHIISQGYEISAITTVNFDKTQAEEFLEVYKGVVPDYSDHVIQLSSGQCVALEIRAENCVKTFRMSAGPWDASMAKELYPASIRGKYAFDNVRNAIHCTDLPKDAPLECEYVFNILEG
jgi:nucleoside-diphosphate kinase